jgi:ribonuclease HII
MAVIIGCDEVGLGPIAGAVVVCAVAFDEKTRIHGLTDSKALTPYRRAALLEAINAEALHWVLAWSSAKRIDRYGIAVCKRACMTAVAKQCLARTGGTVIVDGVDPIPGVESQCIIRADAKIQAVSAASVLAKVYRDDQMMAAAERWPRYGFDRHKGYPTPMHIRALQRYGPCPIHRRSYGPVKNVKS